MILAPNHLRRLSGSKILFYTLCILLFGACKAGKKTVSDVPQATYNQPTMEVDTIAWTDDTTAPEPIESDEIQMDNSGSDLNANDTSVPSTEKKEAYNISVLFPFYSDAYNPENDRSRKKSLRAIHLYAGMQLAVEKLEKEGVKMNIDVMDTKGKTDVVRSQFQKNSVYNSDVIFGPFRSDNLKIGAEVAKQMKRPFISPMNPSSTITNNNPYYIQVKPSLESHCVAITNHVMEKYSPAQVVLVARDKSGEKQRMALFQNAMEQHPKTQKGERFREYLVSDYGNEFDNMQFENYIIEGVPTVFVVPSWSSETFINNVLRKIRLVKGENEVVVYGMPQWKKFERVSYDYFDALNVHISSDNQLDKSKKNIQNFAKAYFYKFGESPSEDAYYGYDMTLYMGRMLIKYGNQFQSKIDAEPYMGLGSAFDFQTVYDLSDDNLETAPLKYIENKHVDILHFKEFVFQLVE